jgi:dCMP deaminase
MIKPHKVKFHPFYWAIVEAAAAQSVATRHKVGAVLVMPTGMISTGWNGSPSGLPDECETWDDTLQRYKTKPETVHAERNAIDKMTREGVSTKGSVLFVTRAPCFECAKALMGLGLEAVYYREEHDDMRGLELLHHAGIRTDHEAPPVVRPPPPPTKPERYNLAA